MIDSYWLKIIIVMQTGSEYRSKNKKLNRKLTIGLAIKINFPYRSTLRLTSDFPANQYQWCATETKFGCACEGANGPGYRIFGKGVQVELVFVVHAKHVLCETGNGGDKGVS